MKRIILIVTTILLFNIANAKNTETRSVSDYNKLKVCCGIKVNVVNGDKGFIKIESNINNEYIITEVKNNMLEISLTREGQRINKKEINININITEGNLVEVNMSSSAKLNGLNTTSDCKIRTSSSANVSGKINAEHVLLNTSSSGKINLDIDTKELVISASSSGKIDINKLKADFVEIDASSSADVVIKGNAEKSKINVSSSGNVNCAKLEQNESTIRASSSGKALVKVNNKIIARANSAGSIRYICNPEYKTIEANSGGSVKQQE